MDLRRNRWVQTLKRDGAQGKEEHGVVRQAGEYGRDGDSIC